MEEAVKRRGRGGKKERRRVGKKVVRTERNSKGVYKNKK